MRGNKLTEKTIGSNDPIHVWRQRSPAAHGHGAEHSNGNVSALTGMKGLNANRFKTICLSKTCPHPGSRDRLLSAGRASLGTRVGRLLCCAKTSTGESRRIGARGQGEGQPAHREPTVGRGTERHRRAAAGGVRPRTHGSRSRVTGTEREADGLESMLSKGPLEGR